MFNTLFFFYILFIFIILNQSFIYSITVNLYKLLNFLFSIKDKKKYNEQYEYLKTHSLENLINTERFIYAPLKPFIVKNNVNFMNDPNLLSKQESLTLNLNMLTTPTDLFGNWKSDSIFRINYEDRGKDNKLKRLYLSALTQDKNIHYRRMIKKYLDNKFNEKLSNRNFFDFCLNTTIDLTYILHFNKLPEEIDKEHISEFFKSITEDFSNIDIFNHYFYTYKLKYKYKRIKYNIKETIESGRISIIKYWHEAGLDIEYMYIEFIHNIIGMTMNWFNLTYNYLLGLSNKKIPFYDEKEDLNKYLFETNRFTCPARYITSKVKNDNYKILHNLYKITRNKEKYGDDSHTFNVKHMNGYEKHMSKCPFKNNKKIYKDKDGELIPCGFSINKDKKYVNFGVGYRRCPGELISLTYLEELIKIINKNKNKIELDLKESNKKIFMFSFFERNYTFK